MRFKVGHGHRFATDCSKTGAGWASLSWRLWVVVAVAVVTVVSVSAVPSYAGRQSIQKVDIVNRADSVQITVASSGPLSIRDGRIGARFILFELRGHLDRTQKKRVSINSGGIKMVRCCWYRSSPPIARIAVATAGVRRYSMRFENGKRLTTITVQKAGAVAPRVVTVVKSAKTALKPTELSAGSGPISTISAPDVSVQPVMVAAARPVRASGPGSVELEPALQVESKPVMVASAGPVVVRSTPAASSAPKAAPKTISLDFVASDLHDVLKALAVQSGDNVVASPDVKGNVTVSLNDVTVAEALKLVTNLSGYKFAYVDGSYAVGTADNLKSLAAGGVQADRKVTEVALVQYADPVVLGKLLEKEFGMVQVSSGSEAKEKESGPTGAAFLVLSGCAADVEAAKAMVSAIEESVRAAAASSAMEAYEVKYAAINELPALLMGCIPGLRVSIGPDQGFRLECSGAVSIEVGGTPVGAQGLGEAQKAPPRVLILQGAQEAIAKAKEFLAEVDVPQQQIVIEARVVDITDSGAKDLGIDWGGEFGTLSDVRLTETRSTADDAIKIHHIARSGLNISGQLKAIVSSGKGKVLASPNVMTLDGKPASIFIGDEVKYVTRVDETESGITVTTETARVGVQLHCISRISSDGYITMDLHPEVSVITGWKELPRVELALPEISRRYVDSTVRVKDGETIVIGGLIKNEEIRKMSGIPLLKDLPIIGGLFRYDSKSKNYSEVMMYITPKILPPT